MKRVFVSDLWPGDVYRPYKDGPVRRIVDIEFVPTMLDREGRTRVETHVRLSGDGFDEFMYMTDVVWRVYP